MGKTGNSKLETRNAKLKQRATHTGQGAGCRDSRPRKTDPESRTTGSESRARGTGPRVPRQRYVRNRPIQNPKSKIQNSRTPSLQSAFPNPETQGPLAISRADILGPARVKMRDVLEKAIADPNSDAYTMLEIICLNHLIEAELKTREMDVTEVLRARNQGKQMAVKAAESEAHAKNLEIQTEKASLQNRMLEHDLAQIRKELQQAGKAQKGSRTFDYERTLNQISAVVGLRGPEKFRYEKQPPQADEKPAPQADEKQEPQAN